MLPDHLFCLDVPLDLKGFDNFIQKNKLAKIQSSAIDNFSCASECWGKAIRINDDILFGAGPYSQNIGVVALYQDGKLYFVSCDA